VFRYTSTSLPSVKAIWVLNNICMQHILILCVYLFWLMIEYPKQNKRDLVDIMI